MAIKTTKRKCGCTIVRVGKDFIQHEMCKKHWKLFLKEGRK